MDLILGHEIDLVIDTPPQGADHARDGFVIRRNAIETGVNVLTAMDTARALVTSLENTDIRQLTLIDIAKLNRCYEYGQAGIGFSACLCYGKCRDETDATVAKECEAV